MSHTVRDKKMLLTRLKKIQGQSTALEKMLNSDHECAEVLQQLAAIRGAVNGMMMQVIEGHLTDHVVKEPEEEQREAASGSRRSGERGDPGRGRSRRAGVSETSPTERSHSQSKRKQSI